VRRETVDTCVKCSSPVQRWLRCEETAIILGPVGIYSLDFYGEAFRVLKEKEFREYGEYRTCRLVLEAWKR